MIFTMIDQYIYNKLTNYMILTNDNSCRKIVKDLEDLEFILFQNRDQFGSKSYQFSDAVRNNGTRGIK